MLKHIKAYILDGSHTTIKKSWLWGVYNNREDAWDTIVNEKAKLSLYFNGDTYPGLFVSINEIIYSINICWSPPMQQAPFSRDWKYSSEQKVDNKSALWSLCSGGRETDKT